MTTEKTVERKARCETCIHAQAMYDQKGYFLCRWSAPGGLPKALVSVGMDGKQEHDCALWEWRNKP